MLKYRMPYYSIEQMSTKLKRRTLAEYLAVLRSLKTERSCREGIYFPITCRAQLLAGPSPLRNGRAASTICGARPIS